MAQDSVKVRLGSCYIMYVLLNFNTKHTTVHLSSTLNYTESSSDACCCSRDIWYLQLLPVAVSQLTDKILEIGFQDDGEEKFSFILIPHTAAAALSCRFYPL